MYLVSTLAIALLESLIDLNIHVHSLASYRIHLPPPTHTSIRFQAFSDDVEEFRTFEYSLYYLTGSLTGDFSFAAGVFRANRYLGAIYIVTYTCFISFVGASMFIAIIDMSFATVHGEAWDESGEQKDPLVEEMRRQYHKIRRSIGWVLHQFHLKRSLERARVKARLAMHLDKKEDILHRRKARHDQTVIGMVRAGGDREEDASIDRTIPVKGEMGEGAAAEGKNTASDAASMWTMAAERFATLPFSNGHDKRYEAIKAEIRALYGETAINEDNKMRLKNLAVSKGADREGGGGGEGEGGGLVRRVSRMGAGHTSSSTDRQNHHIRKRKVTNDVAAAAQARLHRRANPKFGGGSYLQRMGSSRPSRTSSGGGGGAFGGLYGGGGGGGSSGSLAANVLGMREELTGMEMKLTNKIADMEDIIIQLSAQLEVVLGHDQVYQNAMARRASNFGNIGGVASVTSKVMWAAGSMRQGLKGSREDGGTATDRISGGGLTGGAAAFRQRSLAPVGELSTRTLNRTRDEENMEAVTRLTRKGSSELGIFV